MNKNIIVSFLLFFFPLWGFSQKTISIFGKIIDNSGKAIPFVQVFASETTFGTQSNDSGLYKLELPKSTSSYIIEYKLLGYLTRNITIQTTDSVQNITVVLEQSTTDLDEIQVTDEHIRNASLTRIDRISVEQMPTVGLNSIESILKTLPGVNSSNELSSQYAVRGGNYDENLVYVNDIEVYRPMLTRSGQQEGLSFVNPDLVSSVFFSAGGFEAKYGGKMSSVLDVKYRKPKKFAASASASLLGATAHIEATGRNINFITGIRYKASEYILSSLETDGDYKPNFVDWQSFLNIKLNTKLDFNLLNALVANQYNFVPSDRLTDFGTLQDAVSIYVDFDGLEEDLFQSILSAAVLDYHPMAHIRLKWVNSFYSAYEEENFDIQGRYLLNELDKQIGASSLGDSLMNLGIGAYHDHARNDLFMQIYSSTINFKIETDQNKLSAGLQVKRKEIYNNINEWHLLDSAGYSIPYQNNEVLLQTSMHGKNSVGYNELDGFVQNEFDFHQGHNKISFITGLRSYYSALNHEFNLAPRAILAIRPAWKKDVLFRFATGLYHQYPFYKEYLTETGNFNTSIKSQKSFHLVGGFDQTAIWWGRPFKMNIDLYYKYLYDIIPYEVDNIRIKYHSELQAEAYAAGIDFRVFGQFVEGVDSWFSFSLMKTDQDIWNDNEGYFARPSDQRLSVSLFFQDYLPGYEQFKMHLALFHASGVPFGAPQTSLSKHTLRMPAYNRVDLGLSAKIWAKQKGRKFDNLWLSLEVYNLLGINNTVSYLWLTVVPNQAVGADVYNQYAIPNRLTARRLNLKLSIKF